MDKFAKTWTYRDPLTTVTYPAGYETTLPPKQQLKARRAGVLVPPEIDDGQRLPAARAPRRTRKAQGK